MNCYEEARASITAPSIDLSDHQLLVRVLQDAAADMPPDEAFRWAIQQATSPQTSVLLRDAVALRRELLQAEADERARQAFAASPEGLTLRAQTIELDRQSRTATANAARTMLVEDGLLSAADAAELSDDDVLLAAGIEQPRLEGQAARVAAEDARYADPVEREKLLREREVRDLEARWWTSDPDKRRQEAARLGLDPDAVHAQMRRVAGMD
jgi:hypothetical protein